MTIAAALGFWRRTPPLPTVRCTLMQVAPLFMHPEHCSRVLQALFDPLCHHEAVLHAKRTCAASLIAASTALAELPEVLLHVLLPWHQYILHWAPLQRHLQEQA